MFEETLSLILFNHSLNNHYASFIRAVNQPSDRNKLFQLSGGLPGNLFEGIKERNLKIKSEVPFSNRLYESHLCQNCDIRCLRAFWTFRDFKLHLIAFIKGFEPLLLNGREMDENITSILPGNESIALLLIKPFNPTFGHYNSPPLFLKLK